MERKYSRIRKSSQSEFLLQKHIKEGVVELANVVAIHGILSILFLVLVAYLFGVAFNLPYIAGIWLLWGLVGAILSGKFRKNRIIYAIVTLVPTACVVVTGHVMNSAYWLYSKTFHKS